MHILGWLGFRGIVEGAKDVTALWSAPPPVAADGRRPLAVGQVPVRLALADSAPTPVVGLPRPGPSP